MTEIELSIVVTIAGDDDDTFDDEHDAGITKR